MPCISIYNKCNNNCIMCTNPDKFWKMKQGFSLPYLLKRINRFYQGRNEFIDNYRDGFSISGGEPTLSENLIPIIKKINYLFPTTKVTCLTNGRRFFYQDYTKRFLQSVDNTKLAISIHGHNAKLHDAIACAPGSFSQTVTGIKNIIKFRRHSQCIEIRVVIHRLNYRFLIETIKFIKNNFPTINRLVFIFFEIEGQAYKNLGVLRLTYTQLHPYLSEIFGLIRHFPEVHFYHFPLCVLEPFFWPHAWRTLPAEEITYLSECQKCLLKKYCLGIHKSYLNYVKKPEIQPWGSLKGIEIKETRNFYHPINSVKIDKVLSDLISLTRLTDFLMSRETEPTKYFFSSLFFRLNPHNLYNAYEIKQWWLKAVKNIKEGKQSNLLNFYLHIPFCKSRCSYCMYPSSVFLNKKAVDRYLERISEEMSFYKDAFSEIEFKNIYIGGGCPSILDEKQLTKLLTNLSDNFSFSKFGERNFESNPRDITFRKLQIIKKFGFNRVSFGIQSLDSKVLRYANRNYQTYESVKKAIVYAQSCGLRVNVDLMVGLFRDSLLSVKESFQKIIRLRPNSISLYPLKPPASYLKDFFGNNEKFFYSQLRKKINHTLNSLKAIAVKYNYTYPEAIYLSEGYCRRFRQKEERETKSLYYTDIPYSIFGIGSFSVSKIIGIGRYNNYLSIENKFDPWGRCYQGVPCQLKDDMRDYILEHFAKGHPISKKDFKRIFNQSLIDSFSYSFFALKKLKKIKIEKDKIYFLPRDLKEILIYGLFFWDEMNYERLLENLIPRDY